MSNAERPLVVDHTTWTSFFEELGRESERAAAILSAAWIDDLLRRKFELVYSKGTAAARRQLFEVNGPFASFASKLNLAFCAGWLDADVHHDLQVIRKIRNRFAHQPHGLSMESPDIRGLVESFRVPHRDLYDWGTLKCAAKADGTGIVFYTDSVPDGIGETLTIPAVFTFRMAASWAVAYLAANLGVSVTSPPEATPDNIDEQRADAPESDA